jgi:uncharacterized protein
MEAAAGFISAEKEVGSAQEALAGACDILAEQLADDAHCREYIRERIMKEGRIVSEGREENMDKTYEMYFAYDELIQKTADHRILALNRGEKEKALNVKITAPDEEIVRFLKKQMITGENEEAAAVLEAVCEDSYKRLIFPSVEREIRNELTERAEDNAIVVFGKNLKALLMQPPIAGQVVLGWDPAFRTGCKLAVVDATGKVLDTVVIYPTAPQNKVEEAKRILKTLIKKYGVTVISVGNGTASRESEQVIQELIREVGGGLQYVITNEAGASVYSASKLATEEFPQFDVGQRSAASIARRLQDPLAELVKIDPKAIGVGQYQHDMNQKKLGETLEGVVETCVNKVGVDLNTASAPLLQYISGISKAIAKNIVDYREANGRFKSRAELLNVPKLGPKAYEQCAGFLRITDGENPLDATSVHPESYEATLKLMDKLGITFDDVRAAQKNAAKAALEKPAPKSEEKPRPKKKPKQVVIRNTGTAMGAALAAALAGSDLAVVEDDSAKEPKAGKAASSEAAPKENSQISAGSLSKKVTEAEKKKLSEELGIGEITLTDILSELEKPSRDPRENMPAPILRSDVLDMKDLKPGMILKGTVRNVIDFGCFVDIGVHQDGLVHISHITDKYIKHPLEAVSVGDIVDVQVLDVELDKKRISLTMKLQDPAKVAAEAAAKAASRPAPKAKASDDGAKAKATAKRVSVVQQVAEASGVTRKPAEKKATAKSAPRAEAKANGASASVAPKAEAASKAGTASASAASAPSAASTVRKAPSKAATGAVPSRSATGSAPAKAPAKPASGDAPAAPKTFKKKGIVIFKGNAND